MNFDELDKLVCEKAGVNICPICGTPFKRYHSRQRTCASDECRKAWKVQSHKEWCERKKAENIEAYRKYRNELARKTRAKKREIRGIDDELEMAQEYWERFRENHELEISDGMEYGKTQVQRTLDSVPKINTELGGKNNE